LFPRLGRRRRRKTGEQGAGELRLEIERDPCAGDITVVDPGTRREREVEHRDMAVAIDHHIARMDISVDHSERVESRVSIEHREREGTERVPSFVRGERTQLGGHRFNIRSGAPIEHEKGGIAQHPASSESRPHRAGEVFQHRGLVVHAGREPR
jgi:hypothetical protein